LTIKLLSQYLQLTNTFNIQNTVELTHGLKAIPVNLDTSLASFYIQNMYTNIPNNELILITHAELKKLCDKTKQK
jgi:hypothetical protein